MDIKIETNHICSYDTEYRHLLLLRVIAEKVTLIHSFKNNY